MSTTFPDVNGENENKNGNKNGNKSDNGFGDFFLS